LFTAHGITLKRYLLEEMHKKKETARKGRWRRVTRVIIDEMGQERQRINFRLTKNSDKACTLVNAATLSGYSTTPVSPSRRLMLR
jgi:hypothetical protein